MKKKLLFILMFFTQQFMFSQTQTICYQSVKQGAYHGIGLKADGTLWFWGNNSNGQFGDGFTSFNNVYPLQIGNASNWQEIFVGANSSYGIKTNRTLWAWGNNVAAELGDGTLIDKLVPTQIGTATNWLTISPSAQGNHVLGLKTNGTIWSWGRNSSGQLGNGTVGTNYNLVPTQIGIGTTWSKIAAGYYSSYAIKSDGTLWAWGTNNFAELGIGNFNEVTTPTQIGTDTNWQTVISGSGHTIAKKTNGTYWIWGVNTDGALGNGTTSNSSSPIQFSAATIWKDFGLGNGHTIGIKLDGTLWAWGSNFAYNLGNGSTVRELSPIQIGTASNWDKILTSYASNLAIKNDGTMLAWGNNSSGQLANGSILTSVTPAVINCPISLAVNQNETNQVFKLYPNPVIDFLNIENVEKIDQISIVTMLGQEIKIINNPENKIDVSNLEKGVYVLKIKTETGNKVFKFNKK
ncbi:T9SS type A sorting domain-containing protein [Flavobacterium sp.]|uniref:RCC1 domain-containing protein n=1 Tax=Flavobacterium sp. TaxID=239 RepID=UPI0037534CC0